MKTLADRFWPKVNKSGPVPDLCPELGACWDWTASRNKTSGYGVIWSGEKTSAPMLYAHRVAYELEVGDIPDGLTPVQPATVRQPGTPRPVHDADQQPPRQAPTHDMLSRSPEGRQHVHASEWTGSMPSVQHGARTRASSESRRACDASVASSPQSLSAVASLNSFSDGKGASCDPGLRNALPDMRCARADAHTNMRRHRTH